MSSITSLESPIINQPYHVTQLCVIDMTGGDALDFINRQVTNDLALLSKPSSEGQLEYANQWHWNSICNVQGRVIATFIMAQTNHGYKLICHQSMSEKLISLFMKLKFRAKVSVMLSDEKVYLHPNEMTSNKSRPYVELPNASFHLTITHSHISDKDGSLLFQHYLFSENIPLIDDKTTELFVAQHINLENLDALNFSKGCFPGQEVIARLHYKGKSKKSLQLWHFNEEDDNEFSAAFQISEGEAVVVNKTRYIVLSKLQIENGCYCQVVG